MKRQTLVCSALLVVLLFATGPLALAKKCTVNTFPNWDNNITNGWSATAQVLVAPTGCNKLVEYQFQIAGRPTDGELTFSIYAWTHTGPTGNALFTATLPWGTSPSVIVVSNINVEMTPGARYGAVIDLLGSTGLSVYYQANQDGYPEGYGFWSNSGLWSAVRGTNHRFGAKWAKP